MSINSFGRIVACSCLGSLFYSVSLLKLPNLWAGSFLVKTAANSDSVDPVKVRFYEVDRSVFQNPARLLTRAAIALAQTPSVEFSQSPSGSLPQSDSQSQIGFTQAFVRPAAKFLPLEPMLTYYPPVRLISTHTVQSVATLIDWSEQPQISVMKRRSQPVLGSHIAANRKAKSDTALLRFSSRQILSGHSFLPQKQAVRPSLKHLPSIRVLEVEQRQHQAALFQVWVNQTQVAEFLEQAQADSMAQQLWQVSRDRASTAIDWDSLQPARTSGLPSGKAGNTVLFVVDQPLAEFLNRSSDLIAIDWVNRLRVALNAKPLPLVKAQTQMYGLIETRQKLEGIASWYGPYFHGRLTAMGEIFNQGDLTAAHPSLPFNTFLKVTNLVNGQSVIVRINDRGPYVGDRSLDLSRQAAHHLGGEKVGIISYRALIMKHTGRADVSASDADSTSIENRSIKQAIVTSYDLVAAKSSESTKMRWR